MQNILLYMSTALIWGSTWIVITFQLGTVDPLLSVAYRFGLAAAMLLVFCYFTGRFKNPALGWKNHFFIALQGILLFFLNYWVFYMATGYLTSGLIAVLFSTIVVMNIVNQAVFFRVRVEARVITATILGLVGIAMVFAPEIQTLNFEDETTIGLVLCAIATLLASFGNMVIVRNSKAKLPVIETNAFGMAYGSTVCFLAAVIMDIPITFDTSFDYLWSLVYLAVLGSVIAFGCYLTLVGRIGADKAAYVAVLFPIVALTLSTFFEGYQWSLDAIAGVALILIGNMLVLMKKELLIAAFRKIRPAAPQA